MITIVFSTSTKLMSRIIRWFTKSPASHVSFGLDWYGYEVILESSLGGVIPKPRNRWAKNNTIVEEYRVEGIEPKDLSVIMNELDAKYDYVGILGYVPILIYRWFGKKIKNPLASSKALVCSEFVLALDPTREKIPEWKTLDPESSTPKDLLDICRTSDRFKLV